MGGCIFQNLGVLGGSAFEPGLCGGDTHSFNVPDATPVVGDFGGDGKTDLAIYHDASGLWLGRMSGSDYALSYQMLGGGGYVPVAGRFYHTQRHTFGVYHPSTGAWLVQYTPAVVGEDESSGGPFGIILSTLTEGIGSWAVHGAVGWVLDLLTNQNSGEQAVMQQMSQQLNAMDAQMNTLIGMSATIESTLNILTQDVGVAVTTLETDIQWQPVQNAIDNLKTYYDQVGGLGMATFFSSAFPFTNAYPSTTLQYNAISLFVGNVESGPATMALDVTILDGAMIPNPTTGAAGLLGLWTTALIDAEATADSLFDCYKALEYYYAYIYSYIMKAAAANVDVLTYTKNIGVAVGDEVGNASYVLGVLTPMITNEVAYFEQCTYQILLSKADFVNDFNVPQFSQFVPQGAATNILFRNVFMAAQALGTNAYGLNAMFLCTMDAVTNGMPPIIALSAAGQSYSPVTSRWISMTGPTYPCWGNGRMHANQYAVLQYGFGTNHSTGVWTFYPYLSDQPYAGNTLVGLYDDSLTACPTGNLYGCYVGQSRSTAAPYFSTNSTTHQVLGETKYQGAIMSTAVQA